jgi:hypothetical protein
MQITLPVSGKEIELASWTWEESRTFWERAKAFLVTEAAEPERKTRADWMEHVLRQHYPGQVLEQVFVNSPDAIQLYNETVRYNMAGPEQVKNSFGSGTGKQTQSESDTAAPAADPAAED